MDDEQYRAIYEAVYLYDRLQRDADRAAALPKTIRTAAMRILAANGLLAYDGGGWVLSDEHRAAHRAILDTIIGADPTNHYRDLYAQALNEREFLFHRLDALEYDIYSRYNYQINHAIGPLVASHVSLAHTSVLELGGNSGGLAAALLTAYPDCRYTIVDTAIPCRVGMELNQAAQRDITFREGDFFTMRFDGERYDYIVLMNILHDYEDGKCLEILRNCRPCIDRRTRFLVIEDVLTGALEPREAVLLGLRLSVYCRGGRQRQTAAIAALFAPLGYQLERTVRLDAIHTMLVMGAV